jgi:hypothetical protein
MRLLYSQGDEEQKERQTSCCWRPRRAKSRWAARQEDKERIGGALSLAFSLCLPRPARPRFGYVNLLLAVRWTGAAKAVRSTVAPEDEEGALMHVRMAEIRPYFLSLRLGRETDFFFFSKGNCFNGFNLI